MAITKDISAVPVPVSLSGKTEKTMSESEKQEWIRVARTTVSAAAGMIFLTMNYWGGSPKGGTLSFNADWDTNYTKPVLRWIGSKHDNAVRVVRTGNNDMFVDVKVNAGKLLTAVFGAGLEAMTPAVAPEPAAGETLYSYTSAELAEGNTLSLNKLRFNAERRRVA